MKKFFIFILLSGLFLCFSQHAYAKIVFASKGRLGSDNFDIWLMNDDGTLVRLTNDPADERCPHFSPDGSKVAYTRYSDGIRIIDLETMEDYHVPNTNGGAGSNLGARPRPDIVRDWGPCNKILFCNEEPVGMGQVWEINPDGSGRRQITFEPNGDSPPAAWSPDCSMIAFSQSIPYIGGSFKVCTTPVSHFDSTTIYDSPHNDHVLDWSPDGNWILFNRFGVGELWIVSPDGQISAKVISAGKRGKGAFTSDGNHIVYSDRDNIYVTDLSGSEIRQLTSGREIDTDVDIWGKVPVVGKINYQSDHVILQEVPAETYNLDVDIFIGKFLIHDSESWNGSAYNMGGYVWFFGMMVSTDQDEVLHCGIQQGNGIANHLFANHSGSGQEYNNTGIPLETNHWYRLRLWRVEQDSEGKWGWLFTIYDYESGQEWQIGTIRTQGAWLKTFSTFVEIAEPNPCLTNVNYVWYRNPVYRDTSGGPFTFKQGIVDYYDVTCDNTNVDLVSESPITYEMKRNVTRVTPDGAYLWIMTGFDFSQYTFCFKNFPYGINPSWVPDWVPEIRVFGHCLGMAVTSLVYYYLPFISISECNVANKLGIVCNPENKWDDPEYNPSPCICPPEGGPPWIPPCLERCLIEYNQLLFFLDGVRNHPLWDLLHWIGNKDIHNTVQINKLKSYLPSGPQILILPGHAIVAYGMTIYYVQKAVEILVYDPNYPLLKMTLRFEDSNGDGWYTMQLYDGKYDIFSVYDWTDHPFDPFNWFSDIPFLINFFSPIDIEVVDPEGRIINQSRNDFSNGCYVNLDINNDGDQDGMVLIPKTTGEYLITVVPKPDASPSDTYTLKVSYGGDTLVLAENVPISDIPAQPYIIESTEEGISQKIPGDLDSDGDVDRDDLNILLTYRNQPASACPECDLDGDGVITVLDARKLVLLCTRPRCATE